MNIKCGITAILGAYLICTLEVSPVMAATIKGIIKVNIPNGDFAGVYTGDFTYDDTHLTKVGSEYMTINGDGGPTLSGLRSFNFRFLDFASGRTPITYTIRDVDEFPNYPLLVFENGIPTEFALQVFYASRNEGFLFADAGEFRYGMRNGTYGGDGHTTLEISEENTEPTPIPENSSPFASLLAFLGLGRFNL